MLAAAPPPLETAVAFALGYTMSLMEPIMPSLGLRKNKPLGVSTHVKLEPVYVIEVNV